MVKKKSTRKAAKSAREKGGAMKSTLAGKAKLTVEFVKPQVIRLKLEPQIINIKLDAGKKHEKPLLWNALGESSLIVTLITAIFFMIGWTYESNWYGYFNIDPSQVNTPIPQILIRGLPTVLVAVLIILVSIFCFPFVVFAFNLSKEKAQKDKWWVIFVVSLVLMLVLSSYFLYKAGNTFASLPSLPEAGAVTATAVVLVVFGMRETLLTYLQLGLGRLKKFKLFALLSESINEVKHIEIKNDGWIVIGSSIYILVLLLISASSALRDAAHGQKGIGSEKMQEVFLVSPKALSYMNDLESAFCLETNDCYYGPLGLIAENDNYFFLTKLNSGQAILSRSLGLYKIPRADSSGYYTIIPASITLPTPSFSYCYSS